MSAAIKKHNIDRKFELHEVQKIGIRWHGFISAGMNNFSE
jgi:hypothetical protein